MSLKAVRTPFSCHPAKRTKSFLILSGRPPQSAEIEYKNDASTVARHVRQERYPSTSRRHLEITKYGFRSIRLTVHKQCDAKGGIHVQDDLWQVGASPEQPVSAGMITELN